jgi:hypothetical protein
LHASSSERIPFLGRAEIMSDGQASLTDAVQSAVRDDPFWESYLCHLISQHGALHVAIFMEPYLQFILDGRKTIESRFSARRRAPYECIQRGDVVLLKRSGGPIVGISQIADVWFYGLDPLSWRAIREEFTEALCAQDPSFWEQRQHASFATLMRLQRVRALSPIACAKRDRRGWVVLRHPHGEPPLRKATRPMVLVFAGRLASGKSTLSAGVAGALGWPYVSFGEYVRQVARSRGLDWSRHVLQELGAALIGQDCEGFCRAVLGQTDWDPGQPLVIDGLRHVEAVDVLRQLVAPSTLLLIFITVNEPARKV